LLFCNKVTKGYSLQGNNVFGTILHWYLFLLSGFDRGYTAAYRLAEYFGRLRGIRAARTLAAAAATASHPIQPSEEQEAAWSLSLSEIETQARYFGSAFMHF
jgi:hypothetical protein